MIFQLNTATTLLHVIQLSTKFATVRPDPDVADSTQHLGVYCCVQKPWDT